MTYFDDVKRWWASRTIWLGALLTVFGSALEVVNSNSSILAPYFGKWGPLFIAGVGVAVALLRLLTTKPIGKPEAVKAGGTSAD